MLSVPSLSSRHPFYDALPIARRMARRLDGNNGYLFHGTRYSRQICQENVLRKSDIGQKAAFFSTRLHVAAYWAMLPRDDDEGVGAILVLDRERIEIDFQTYRNVNPMRAASEYELLVYEGIKPLNEYLLEQWRLQPGDRLSAYDYGR